MPNIRSEAAKRTRFILMEFIQLGFRVCELYHYQEDTCFFIEYNIKFGKERRPRKKYKPNCFEQEFIFRQLARQFDMNEIETKIYEYNLNEYLRLIGNRN